MRFLEISDLHIDLKEFSLSGVSLSLDRGDYLTIIGPTGAGKTIFLESIVGFWKPARGRIILNGRDITDALPENRHIGIVYQDYALLPHMTVYRNIAYGLKKRHPENMDASIRKMAASLRINHLLHRKPATLSGGEQQRVALARVLVVKPELLLMDEPFSSLDQQTRRRARLLLKAAVRECGTTVIHITHDLDDAWAFADKLAVFKKGRLLQSGSMTSVFSRPRSRFVADFVGAGFFNGTVVSRENESSTIDLGGLRLTSLDRVDNAKLKFNSRFLNIYLFQRTTTPKNALGTTFLDFERDLRVLYRRRHCYANGLEDLTAYALALAPDGKVPAILLDGYSLQGFQVLLDLGPLKTVARFRQTPIKLFAKDQCQEAAKDMASDRPVFLVEDRTGRK